MSDQRKEEWPRALGMMEGAIRRLTDRELADLLSLAILEMNRRGIVEMNDELSHESLQERIAAREAKEKEPRQ